MDTLHVVGGEHGDDVGRLRIDTVDDVQDIVHFHVPLAVHDTINVFAEDDARGYLILAGEVDCIGQLVGTGNVNKCDARFNSTF